jgi:uncharacterized membrane protein YgcG
MPAVLAPLLGLTLAQAQPLPAGGMAVGTFLLQSRPIDRVELQQITYLGDCPGEEQPELRGVSFLAAVPPAPYQRILIQNRTTGGYTDREYDERRPTAQSFSVALGQGQRGSFLTLVPGPNSFTYQVNNRVQKRMLDQGTANLLVAVNRLSQNRSFSEIREDRYCSGQKNRSRTNLDACPNGLITLERLGVCPAGKTVTLSMETVGTGNRPGGIWGGGYGGSGWSGGGNPPPAGGGWGNPGGNSWGGSGGSGNWGPRY